jgi:cysteine desulfurase
VNAVSGPPRIYLDHAATTPVAREVLDEMLPHLGAAHGNPSSVHAEGRRARNAVDQARDRLAAALGCAPGEVVFTSGGSEADNLALRGVADRRAGGHVVVSAVEHDAVLKTAEALAEQGRIELTVVGCDARGSVDPEQVAAAVREQTVLVSVMSANNETGVIQDVGEISRRVHQRNRTTLFHTDAVQALGKLRVDLRELGADMLTVTGHKVYGPMGAGALVVRRGVMLQPQITGGSQERARRAGTENVAAIVGFGAAVALVERERELEAVRLGRLSESLLELLVTGIPDAVVTGAGAPKLPSFVTLALPGVIGEVLITLLDQMGVEASSGSACASGAHMPSHVLAAMGLPPHLAGGALRLTLGRGTTQPEIERAAAVVVEAVARVRAAPAEETAAAV